MKIRLSNIAFIDGVLTADMQQLDGVPSVPPVAPPAAEPPLTLPKAYNSDTAVAREMLLAAVRENGLNAIDVQGHGDRIVAALKRTYPSLDVYVNRKTDAIVWPGFGSIDCTIDSGKGGFYFRPDPLTDPHRVAWKPAGQR